MEKRWLLPVGLALGLGVAIGVVAVTAPDGRTIVGTASTAAISAPPAVGDCLLGGPDGPFPVSTTTGDGLVSPYSRSFGPCGDVHYGEVTAVVDGQARNVDESGYPIGRLLADCDTALGEYLGAPDPVAVSTDWWASYADWSMAVGPDPRQAGSDQDWAACLFRPTFFGPDGEVADFSPDGSTFVAADSLRGGWADGQTRNRLGACWLDDASPEDVPSFCGDPHRTETLAFTSGDVFSTADQWTASCRTVAARIIGRDDPTLGGALTLAVYRTTSDGAYEPVGADTATSYDDRVECTVRPADSGQQLTSTLASLGDGTPPLQPR